MKPSPTSIRNNRRPKLEAITACLSVSYILNSRRCKSKSILRLSKGVYQFNDVFGSVIVQSQCVSSFTSQSSPGSFASAIASRLRQAASASLQPITLSDLEPTKSTSAQPPQLALKQHRASATGSGAAHTAARGVPPHPGVPGARPAQQSGPSRLAPRRDSSRLSPSRLPSAVRPAFARRSRGPVVAAPTPTQGHTRMRRRRSASARLRGNGCAPRPALRAATRSQGCGARRCARAGARRRRLARWRRSRRVGRRAAGPVAPWRASVDGLL